MNITMLGSGSYKSTLSFRLVQLARQLSSAGNKVELILPSADKYNHFTPDLKAKVLGVHLRQPWQYTTKNAMLNLLPYLFSATWQLVRSRPQLVYIYKPTPITVMGLLPKLFMRRPVILDLDDLGSEVMRRQGQGSIQIGLVALCEKLCLWAADGVVVASTYLESVVRTRYPSKPVIVLANGVDVNQYTTPLEGPVRNHVYYFGAVDNLDLIADFIKAMPAVIEQVPSVRFTVIGGGKALPAAKGLATRLGVRNRIVFTGWSDMFAAQDHTRVGDVAVCYQPDTETVRAASNMKVFQYMAMGSVPVVSNVGDLAEYVERGKAGAVVPPHDPQALAGTLCQLLNDPVRRLKLAKRCRKLAEGAYSWETLGEDLAMFLEPIHKEAIHA